MNKNRNEISAPLRSLFSKSVIYSASHVFRQIVNIVLIPVFTFFLSTEDFGIISLMSLTAGLILQITKTPVAHGFVRFFYEPVYGKIRKKLLFNSVIFALANSAIVFLIFLYFADDISMLLLDSASYTNIIIIYAVIILIQPLEDILQDLVKVQKKAKLFFWFNTSNILLSSSLMIILLYFDYGVMSLVWGNLFISIYPLRFFANECCKNIKTQLNLKALKPLLKYGYPMIPASVSVILLQSIDNYILKIFTDISTVGLYSFGYKFGGLMGFLVIIPIQYIVHPLILEMEKNKEKLLEFLSASTEYIYIFSLFACIVLSLFAQDVVQIMAQKPAFYPAWQFIPIIAFAYVQYGLGDLLGQGVVMSGKTIYLGISISSAAILNILLNLILIPEYGVFGAASATLASYVFLNFLNYYYSKKLYNINVKFKSIYISTVIFLIIILLGIFVKFEELYLNLTYKTLLIMIFPLLLRSFKIIKNKDWEFIRDKINEKFRK